MLEETLRVMSSTSMAILDVITPLSTDFEWLQNFFPSTRLFTGVPMGIDFLIQPPWFSNRNGEMFLIQPILRLGADKKGYRSLGDVLSSPYMHITRGARVR